MSTIQKGDVVGDYRVIDIAGSGGMGAVYKIEHLISRRTEAMKLLPSGSSSDPELVQRFEREIQVQARLHHPNIVELYTAVHVGSSFALVMEFVDGESLENIVKSGPLPVETAVDFAGQVLSALAYAHAAGVIHRDVAPANIIVTPGLVAKLTDFGLARGAADLRLSVAGVPLGSPWYMSPEQVRGLDPLDERTDLYAVGAVLYEMLAGEKMFTAEGAFGVMRAQVEAEAPRPSSRNSRVPAALDAIVRKAVEKDPAKRFQSADEFRLALRDAMLGPIPAAAPAKPQWGSRIRLPLPQLAIPAAAPAKLQWGSRFRPTLPQLAIPVAAPGNQPVAWYARAPRVTAAMAAVALVTAVFGITLLLKPARHVEAKRIAPQAPISTVLEPAVKAPVIAAPAAPESGAAGPAEGVERPLVHQTPQAGGLSRRRQAVREVAKAEPSFAIRVTGGESPAAAAPAPATPAPRPVVAELPSTKSDPVNSQVSLPSAGETDHEEAVAPVETAAAKPSKPGNRLVRALGKINPFRKGAKTDAVEPKTLKQ